MKWTTFFALAVCIGLCSCSSKEKRSAVALEQEVKKICRDAEFWPGYNPVSVPLAVFDGTTTFLFRHPGHPEGFTMKGNLQTFKGRHPSIVANSSAWIDGVPTATVMLATLPAGSTPRERAALVVHEGFHVFQAATGRRWGANEVDLFTYPVEDGELLALRRLETEALRRAFLAREPEAVIGWAQCALGMRAERFAKMDSAYQAYERGIETMEGTATYVEYKAAGRSQPPLPEDGFDAENVRSRAYTTGVAWAFLLDQFDPGWRNGFGADDTIFLDTALAQSLGGFQSHAGKYRFTESERTAAEKAARSDAEGVLALRSERRVQFESKPGWRLVVEADGASPLWPQGIDPLNVTRVEGGVLHSRFVKLGNDNGTAEVMGRIALTEGVGPHPLFNGVRRLILTGFESEPIVNAEGVRVMISLPGFKADFISARVERKEKTILIRLAPPPNAGENQ